MEQITAWRAWKRYIVGLFLMLESVCLSVNAYLSLSFCLCFLLHVFEPFSVYNVYLFFSVYCLSVCLSLSISVSHCLCFSVCLSLFLSLILCFFHSSLICHL